MPQAILLEDVESLGEKGAVVDVSPATCATILVPAEARRGGDQGLDRGGRQASRGC